MQFTKIFPVLTLAILAAAVSSEAQAATLRKSFNVTPGGTLTLRTDRGTIDVHSANQNTVDVEVTTDAGNGSDAAKVLERFKVEFNASGANVDVNGQYNRASSGWLQLFDEGRLHVRFMVKVPSSYNVNIHTSGGDVTVGSVAGNVDASTSGGDLHLGDISGTVDARTSGGAVFLYRATKPASLKTSGGDIRVGQALAGLIARTSGGSIQVTRADGAVELHSSGGGIEAGQISGSIDGSTSGGSIQAFLTGPLTADSHLSSSGGGVSVRLGSGVACDLDASASGGEIDSDVPVTVQGGMSRNHLQGRVNGGGPQLVLRASGGSVEIRK